MMSQSFKRFSLISAEPQLSYNIMDKLEAMLVDKAGKEGGKVPRNSTSRPLFKKAKRGGQLIWRCASPTTGRLSLDEPDSPVGKRAMDRKYAAKAEPNGPDLWERKPLLHLSQQLLEALEFYGREKVIDCILSTFCCVQGCFGSLNLKTAT